MIGPRDIIRQAMDQRRHQVSDPVERIAAPIPVQVKRTNSIPAEQGVSQVSQWRTPPLMQPGQILPQPASGMQTEAAEQARNIERRVPVAQNIGGHTIYRELMRSHDRMGTRHIGRGV